MKVDRWHILLVGIVVFGSMSSVYGGPESEVPWQPNPATVFVDDDPNFVVESIDARGLIAAISDPESQPEVGNILFSTSGEGFLRRVVGVQPRSDGTVYVATEQATLEEAFDELTVSGAGMLSFREVSSRGDKNDPEAKVSIGTSWQVNKSVPITSNASLDASVSLQPDLSFDMDLRISGARLRYAKVVVEGNLRAIADLGLRIRPGLTVSGQAKLTPTGIPLGTIPVGGIPVTISLDVYAGLSGAVGAQGTAGLRAETSGWLKAGAEYSNSRWTPLSGNSMSFNITPRTTFETFASAEVYLKARIATRLLGAAGPYVDLNTPKLRIAPIREGNGRRFIEVRPAVAAAVGFDVPMIDFELMNLQVVEVWFSPRRFPF